ncbi:MAG: OmpA family protein [Flavobacteriales bacterium]|nr:OmpA family protein [Flavobacteriales bacterium]
MIRIIVFAVFLILSISLIQAQGMRRKMADEYFDQLEFSKAAPIYDELAKMNLKGKRSDNQEIRRAAESFMKSVQYAKAEEWYKVLDAKGAMNEEDYMNYFQVQCLNQKYAEAQQIIESLSNKYPSNYLAIAYKNTPNFLSDLKKDESAYVLNVTPFSSGWGDFSPAFYEDGIVFSSYKKFTGFVNRKFTWDNTYFTDLYFVGKKGDKFKKLSTLMGKGFRSKPHDGPATFNKAGNFMVMTRNDLTKSGKKDIIKLFLYSARKNESGKWSKLEPFPFNSKSYSVGHPSLSDDGTTLLFASDMPGGQGGIDIWMCTFQNGSWSKPVNCGPKVNTPGDEMFPVIARDGNVYFASNGHVGLGGLDIFKTDMNFSSVENLGSKLNSHADDFGLITNEEGSIGYITSNRDGWIDRIYEVKIKIPEFIVNGKLVLDDCKKTPVPNAEVILLNKTTGTAEKLTTDAQGNYTKKLNRNAVYELEASKEGYILIEKLSVSTLGKIQSENFETTLFLSLPYVKVNAHIKDAVSGASVPNAKVTIKGSNTVNLTTDASGKASTDLEKNQVYTVSVIAEGYLEYTMTFNSNDANCDNVLDLPLTITKVKKGDVYVFKNIFYDYGKADLRAESIAELNKLVEFLKNNPKAKVELGAHTDSRSNSSFNQNLSQRRAQSVVDYLVKNGIPKSNIIAKGYGETRLVNGCSDGVLCSEDEHQQNRRTEIKILEVK